MGSGQGKQGAEQMGAEQIGSDAACRHSPWAVCRKPSRGCSAVQGSLHVAEALPWVEVMEPATCGSSTGDLGTMVEPQRPPDAAATGREGICSWGYCTGCANPLRGSSNPTPTGLQASTPHLPVTALAHRMLTVCTAVHGTVLLSP